MRDAVAKRALIEKHLRRAGIPERNYEDHIKGWDLRQPVREIWLERRERLAQFITNPSAGRPEIRTGNYFSWAGVSEMDKLGVGSGLPGRCPREFLVARPSLVLAGTAARISRQTSMRFGYALRGRGGADQLFLADQGRSCLVPSNADLEDY